jgi:hypothetical protein
MQRIFPMNSPIKIADAGSVAPPDHKYSCLHAELAEQLISIFRTIFPHDALPDEFYQHVIRKLDEKVAQNADLMRVVGEGVDALNHETGFAWKSLPFETKLKALERLEQTPFFQRLRSDFLVFFYSNPEIWSRFGYEGPSNDRGGYLHRGFNDIDWIKREEL